MREYGRCARRSQYSPRRACEPGEGQPRSADRGMRQSGGGRRPACAQGARPRCMLSVVLVQVDTRLPARTNIDWPPLLRSAGFADIATEARPEWHDTWTRVYQVALDLGDPGGTTCLPTCRTSPGSACPRPISSTGSSSSGLLPANRTNPESEITPWWRRNLPGHEVGPARIGQLQYFSTAHARRQVQSAFAVTTPSCFIPRSLWMSGE
jgi:hypothetical protein